MQTIEYGPWGEELELDNNPQALVLQQSEYFAFGKQPLVNEAPNTGGSFASWGQQKEKLVLRFFFYFIRLPLFSDFTDVIAPHLLAYDQFSPEFYLQICLGEEST